MGDLIMNEEVEVYPKKEEVEVYPKKEEVEERLCRAAIRGDVRLLHHLLKEDELVLEKAVAGYFTINPLHIAALYGHYDFINVLLTNCPLLMKMLDSQYQTALHLASMRGHITVVKILSSERPDMCLACDKVGMNPLHVAAIEGHTDVLEALYMTKPYAAKNRVNGDDTILHLCVKYNQFPSFKLLLLMAGSEFVNAQDGSGNTVLHLAVSEQRSKMVQYLLDEENNIKMDVNATNAMGQTSLDILMLAESQRARARLQERDISSYLLKAGAKTSYIDPQKQEWLTGKRDAIMVVASLIATMAFQAIVSPPGGVWQADTTDYKAGEAVMAHNYPDSYPRFLRANTVGFVASLTTIMFLLIGWPSKRRTYIFLLVLLMWATITSMAFAYASAVTVLTPAGERGTLSSSVSVGIIVWLSLMAFYLAFHTAVLIRIAIQEKLTRINRTGMPTTIIEHIIYFLLRNYIAREANSGFDFPQSSPRDRIDIPESSTRV